MALHHSGTMFDTPRKFAAQKSTSAAPHDHMWRTRSRHITSTGHVTYVQCTQCGTHSVRVHDDADLR